MFYESEKNLILSWYLLFGSNVKRKEEKILITIRKCIQLGKTKDFTYKYVGNRENLNHSLNNKNIL